MTRSIPFGRPMIGQEEKDAVMNVLSGPILVHGPQAKQFEADFAAYTDAQEAITVSSCTAGMHLVWFTLGMGPGDEIIVPAETHVATAHAVELVGATPVFVDACRATGNIDLGAVENAITSRTRAICVVHYLGMPVDMSRVMPLAEKHNLFVLEDCALAVGTRLKDVHAGLLGHAGVFSFYPVKHMTTAEGGMIITNDSDLAGKLRLRKAFGVNSTHSERKVPGVYDVVALGYNYRMNEIQAAIGVSQLKKVDQFLEARKRNYSALEEGLRGVPRTHRLTSSHGPFVSSHYCYSLLLDEELGECRSEIVGQLNAKGVGTSVHYPQPVPRMSYYKEKYGWTEGSYPNAAWLSDCSIALPVGPHVDLDDVAYIAGTLSETLQEFVG